MSPEVIAALIAAAVSFIGATVTLTIGLRSIKVEREKLQTDRERLQVETERLQSEIEKIGVETEKIRAESDDIRLRRLEIERIQLELEKQKGQLLLERRNDVYPEMLELVYRLRNALRDSLNSLKDEIERLDDDHFLFSGPNELGEELYLLTENLYKYRAFIDEETFQMIHSYKRNLQDAKVLVNRMSRPIGMDDFMDQDNWHEKWEEENKKSLLAYYEDSGQQLEEIFQVVDKLYEKITENVKKHTEMVMER